MTKLEDFSISMIEFMPKGRVHYKAIKLDSDDRSIGEEVDKKSERFPHPDLTKYFDGADAEKADGFLKDVVIAAMGYLKVFELKDSDRIGDSEKKAFQKLSVVEQQFYKMVKDSLKIKGIKLNGKGDKSGVVIMFRYNPNGLKKDIKQETPSITLKASTYGFEDDLRDVIREINKEVWEFDENKKSSYEAMKMNEEEEGYNV